MLLFVLESVVLKFYVIKDTLYIKWMVAEFIEYEVPPINSLPRVTYN